MWYAILNQANDEQAEVSIFDEIGNFGIRFADFAKDFNAIPKDKPILLRIHSPGGEVFDGAAIAAIVRRRGNVTAQIEGLAASMASVIACSASRVLMSDGSWLMVHNPWGAAIGDAEELRDQAKLLDRLREQLVNTYRAKTGLPAEEIQTMLDDETWFDAKQALEKGFVDEITEQLPLAAKIRPSSLRRFARVPSDLTSQKKSMSEEQQKPAEEQEPVAPVVEPPAAPVEAPVESPKKPEEKPAVPDVADLQARVQSHVARLAQAEATVTAQGKEIETLRSLLDGLEASKGLSAAAVVAETTPSDPAKGSIIEQYSAIKDTAERRKFFSQHKEEILSAHKAKK